MAAATKMHADEFGIDESLIRQLLAQQFPKWAGLPLEPVPSSGTDNAIYRLGPDLAVRLPRISWSTGQTEKDMEWLPRLSRDLPLSLPVPLALGQPGQGYPWTWGVYEWIAGQSSRLELLTNPADAARQLAEFLLELQKLDTGGGPVPKGSGRGRPLAGRDEETRRAITALEGRIDTSLAAAAWAEALGAKEFDGTPGWIHGDLLPGNVIVADGRLSAVIDWSCLGVADTACDLMIAWSLFTADSREAFRAALAVDEATWARGRGWALSVALIQLPYYLHTNAGIVETAIRTVDEVLADYSERRTGDAIASS